MHSNYLNAIKSFEGYNARAKWDYGQHSVGFGTRAKFAGEEITPDEAERRFAAEIDASRRLVEQHAAQWDEGTKAALTSLTFNAGSRWISSGLGDAIRRNDTEAVKAKFLQYTKAGGSELPGLVRRRFEEMTWIGSPIGTGPTAQGGTFVSEPATPATRGHPSVARDSIGETRLDPARSVALSYAGAATASTEALLTSTSPDGSGLIDSLARDHERARAAIEAELRWAAVQQVLFIRESSCSILEARDRDDTGTA